MAKEENKNSLGKKLSRSQRRRDTENEVFDELAGLLPVSQDIKQDKLSILRLTVAYLKLRKGLDRDDQDLEECLAASKEGLVSPSLDLNIYSEPFLPPLAMLDNQGNLIAGSLHRHPVREDLARITLPHTVLSKLEEQFLSDSQQSDDKETHTHLEKLQKYKEGLEKGMQDFLKQNLSDIQSDYSNSSLTSETSREEENIICDKERVRDTETEQAKSTSITRKTKTYEGYARSKNKTKTKTRSDATVEKEDKPLTVFKPAQESNLILEAALGFILSLDREKTVLFVSGNVTEFLGYSQAFLIGQDVSEFIYSKDYPELQRQMSDAQFLGDWFSHQQPWQIRRTFYMAIKFSFQKSGSRLKDCGFQLYQWNAKLRLQKDKISGNIQVNGLTSLCCPVYRESMLSIIDSANSFMVRFSVKDSRILYCDAKIQDLLGYSPSDLVGHKYSDMKHPSDAAMCRYNYRNLPRDGKCESGYYRMLSRSGTWVWLYTKVNIIYNKDGLPEILVMRSVIVSQAEAICVLSRERKNFEKITVLGHGDVLSTQAVVTSPTIASISFEKQQKRRRSNLDTVSSDVVRQTIQTASMSSSKKATFSRIPRSLGILQQQWQKPNIPFNQPSTSKSCQSINSEESRAIMESGTTKTQNRSQTLLPRPPASDDSGKIINQTLINRSHSKYTVIDTDLATDRNSIYVPSTEPAISASDSESSTEMSLSQKRFVMSSTSTTSFSPSEETSSDQDWSLDLFLFDNNLHPDISNCPLSDEISLEISDVNCLNSGHTDQEGQKKHIPSVQTNLIVPCSIQTGAPYNIQNGTSERHSIQSYSEPLVRNDLIMGDILDLFTEESSTASRALIMPSSGDVMLSSYTAPQSMKSRQGNPVLKNQNEFPTLVSESKYKVKQRLYDNAKCDNMLVSLNTAKNFSNAVSMDFDPPPPVVAGQSDIIYSPDKLDYPPLQSVSQGHHLKEGTTFTENFKQDQKSTSSSFSSKNLLTISSPLCKENKQKKSDIVKNYIAPSTNAIFDLLPQESVSQIDFGSPVKNINFITMNQERQSSDSTSKVLSGKCSPSGGSRVPGFSEDTDKNYTSLNSNDTSIYMIKHDISRKEAGTSINSIDCGENVSSSLAIVNTVEKLPEDLADLELDFDIDVDLNESWISYLK